MRTLLTVALLLQVANPAAPRTAPAPLFPLKIRPVFKADLRSDAYASYRQRVLKAAPADGKSPGPEFAVNSPLFPDSKSEAAAYELLTFPPQLRVFLIRNPTESKVPVEDQDPDVSFVLQSTAADPPVAAGETPVTLPRVEKRYSVSRDGIVSINLPTETVNAPNYSKGAAIVSDLDLVGAQMTLKMSSTVTLQSISFEFAGGGVMNLRPGDFKQSEGRNGGTVYSLRFPNNRDAFLKLIAR